MGEKFDVTAKVRFEHFRVKVGMAVEHLEDSFLESPAGFGFANSEHASEGDVQNLASCNLV